MKSNKKLVKKTTTVLKRVKVMTHISVIQVIFNNGNRQCL